jgi:hypothetical protein
LSLSLSLEFFILGPFGVGLAARMIALDPTRKPQISRDEPQVLRSKSTRREGRKNERGPAELSNLEKML